MSVPVFKYFKNPEKNAVLAKTNCQSCDTSENCLEGEYFDQGGNIDSVCFDCLSKGKITVNIPDYIRNRIINHLNEMDIESKESSNEEKAKNLVDELSKTPPVPWIQYNDWPVCCNDFERYIGEWDKLDIIKNAPDENTRDYLMSILDNFSKEKIKDYDLFWDDIGNGTVIFVFECVHCSKIIAICQSY